MHHQSLIGTFTGNLPRRFLLLHYKIIWLQHWYLISKLPREVCVSALLNAFLPFTSFITLLTLPNEISLQLGSLLDSCAEPCWHRAWCKHRTSRHDGIKKRHSGEMKQARLHDWGCVQVHKPPITTLKPVIVHLPVRPWIREGRTPTCDQYIYSCFVYC